MLILRLRVGIGYLHVVQRYRGTVCIWDSLTELQIRGVIDDNSKIFFFSLNENIRCDPSLEPSRRDGSNDGSQRTF